MRRQLIQLIPSGKVKATLGLLLIHSKVELAIAHTRRGRNDGHFLLFFHAKVGFQNLDTLFINIIVGMLLQFLNFIQAVRFGNKEGHLVLRIGAARFFFSNAEDILQSLQGNNDNLGIQAGQQVAERANAALLDEELDLVLIATGSGVGNGPGGFLANVKFGVGQQLNQGGNDIVFNDGLNLFLVAGCVKNRGAVTRS
jgi:hypothetical protein